MSGIPFLFIKVNLFYNEVEKCKASMLQLGKYVTEAKLMKSYYTEHLISQNPTGKTKGMKAGIIAGAVLVEALLFLFGGYLGGFSLFLMVGVIVLAVWLLKKFDLEFEYTFFDEGDLYIDKIIAQSKRKRVLVTSAKDMEILAPVNSYEAQNFQNLKTLDYSSNEPNAVVYVLVTKHKEERVKVLFEPNQKILDGMKYMAPRKVVL